MKKNFSTIVVLLTISFFGCKEQAKEKTIAKNEIVKTDNKVAEKYKVNTAESIINWAGFKPTGSHSGTVSLSAGEFTVAGDKITEGTFTADMASIIDEDDTKRLIGHLKSPDFFNVAEFPHAYFKVTATTVVDGKTMLSGALSIKNITHEITFPISILNEDNTMTLSGETFKIDRTKWDIKYKSKTIFGNLGDKFIYDDIELSIMVKANKSYE